MDTKLRSSILALAAALVVMAAAAPSALAEPFIFRASTGEEELTGSQDGAGDEITVEAGTVICTSITYSGSATSDEMESLELAPTYSGCTALGSATAEVNVNGCKYRLDGGTLEGGTYEGAMDIVCPTGKTITITAKVGGITACTVHIPPQEGLKTVTYTNVGSAPEELTGILNLTGMRYTQTAGIGCAGGSHENGSYKGAAVGMGDYEGESGALGVDRKGTWMSITPKPLNFKAAAKGKVETITVKNEHATTKYIREMKIVDLNENVDETLFAIVGGTCKEELASLEECTIKIENRTLEAKGRWLRFKYSSWGWFATRHTIKRDIIHE